MFVGKSVSIGIGPVLFVIACAIYAGALGAGFVSLDDPGYASQNSIVASGLTPAGVSYAFRTFDTGNWIPVTWLSLELDATLFGVHPLPFHRTNVILHAINVVLLFVVLGRLTGSVGRSAIVALFFAVHPLHVESVAWISERKDVLSATFLLLSLLAYEHYSKCPSWGRWLLVFAAMTLGLMSKSMLVTLPILLLLVDWCPLKRDMNLYRLYEKLPLLGLSLIDGLITIAAQRSSSAFSAMSELSFPYRVGNALNALGWYLWKTAFPTGLCIFYEHPGYSISWWQVAIPAVIIAGISAYLYSNVREGREAMFGWAWFLISLLPVIGLIQVGGQAYADRYMYIPHMGLFVLVVWGYDAWVSRQQWNPKWGFAVAVGVALFWSTRTLQQVAVWHSSETLWTQVLRQNPECAAAHTFMGMEMLSQDRLDEAEQHLEKVMAIDGISNPQAIVTLASVCEKKGDWQTAAEYYRWVLRQVTAKTRVGQHQARERLAAIERLHPNSSAVAVPQSRPSNPSLKLGMAAARRNEMQQALRHFEDAVQADPLNPDAYNNVALALAELGRFREAEIPQRKAVTLMPDNPDFHVNLAMLLVTNGNPEEARVHFRESLRIRPTDIEARRRLEQLNKSHPPAGK